MVGVVLSMAGLARSMVGVAPSMVGAVPNMVGVPPCCHTPRPSMKRAVLAVPEGDCPPPMETSASAGRTGSPASPDPVPLATSNPKGRPLEILKSGPRVPPLLAACYTPQKTNLLTQLGDPPRYLPL